MGTGSVSRLPKITFVRFSHISRQILLLDAQNQGKAQMFTDTIQNYEGFMLSVVIGEGAWLCHFAWGVLLL